ncbi:membrane cofactor protein-like isoform X3 [Eleginops maclovinus]|uniref:membrane cofactor protein-like isoform X3 n=1 Tax=Eleginops maclovinus TaxID=56733 RepID=UPI003080CF34
MAVSSLLLLSVVGLFITAQAQNCSRPVGGDNMGLKGSDILLDVFLDGIKVNFACDVGYVSEGSSAITCTAGTWSPLRMTCKRKSCGDAGQVDNGVIDYSGGNEFGDQVTVICNPGFDLVGNSQLRCGNSGWEGRLPVCEVTQCDAPPKPAIGSFSPVKDSYEYREVIQYSCPGGYTLKGTKSQTCLESGKFEPAPPECVKVRCEEPTVLNGLYHSGSRGPYIYKSTVTFECDQGYKMINSPTITCEMNNQWEPELPKCERVPPKTTSTTERPTSTKKPPAPGPTAPGPTASATRLYTGLGITFAVIILLIIGLVLWHCGVLPCFKRKSGSRRSPTHPVVSTEDNVVLRSSPLTGCRSSTVLS